MTTITGITVSELIQKTGKSRSAIESWISRNGVKPIIGELLYPPDTLEKIREASRGRPAKKPKVQEPPSKDSPKTSKNES